MAANTIARVNVDDVSLLKDYLNAMPPILRKCGDKLIARGGSIVTLEHE